MHLQELTKRILKGLRYRIDKWIEKHDLPEHDTELALSDFRIFVRNPRTSIIGRALCLDGVWEAEETAVVKAVVAPGEVVIDVGADIGYYTLLFSANSGPNGHVYSFEPNPSSRAWLDKNIELNQARNITSIGIALFDTSGEVALNHDQIAMNTQSPNILRVPTQPFDEWRKAQQIKRVDLIKIDAEGAEMRILRGMRNTILGDRPKLLVEIHPTKLPAFEDSADNVMTFLNDARYLIRPVDRQDLAFDHGNVTVLCRPLEKV